MGGCMLTVLKTPLHFWKFLLTKETYSWPSSMTTAANKWGCWPGGSRMRWRRTVLLPRVMWLYACFSLGARRKSYWVLALVLFLTGIPGPMMLRLTSHGRGADYEILENHMWFHFPWHLENKGKDCLWEMSWQTQEEAASFLVGRLVGSETVRMEF